MARVLCRLALGQRRKPVKKSQAEIPSIGLVVHRKAGDFVHRSELRPADNTHLRIRVL